MVDENALLGFEENGGFMFGPHNQVRDGAMTLALMLDLLSKSEYTIAENIKRLPQSFTTKTKVECTEEESRLVIQHLSTEFPNSATVMIWFKPQARFTAVGLVSKRICFAC